MKIENSGIYHNNRQIANPPGSPARSSTVKQASSNIRMSSGTNSGRAVTDNVVL